MAKELCKAGKEFSWLIDMSIDPVFGQPKDGWKVIDIAATKKQPVKLKVELCSSTRSVTLTCTTNDLKVKEVIRRKRTAKKAGIGAGITTKEAADALTGKGAERNEQPKSPENIQ